MVTSSAKNATKMAENKRRTFSASGYTHSLTDSHPAGFQTTHQTCKALHNKTKYSPPEGWLLACNK